MTVSRRGIREGVSRQLQKSNPTKPDQTQKTWSLSKRNSSKIKCQAPCYSDILMYVVRDMRGVG